MTKLWETASASLATRLADAGVPAVVFWAAVLAVYSNSPPGRVVVDATLVRLAVAPTSTVVVIGLVCLIAVLASGVVVERLVEPALVLMTGSWPGFLAAPGRVLVARFQRRAQRDAEAFDKLVKEDPDSPALARIDERMRRTPGEDAEIRPTRLGNTLRAAERAPAVKYGLDAAVAWPRLWLLLPESTRTEFTRARRQVTGAVSAILWALLFTGTAVIDPAWAVLGPVTVVLVVGIWLPPRVEAYADLIEATFDVHRHLLYGALRWPAARNPADEHELGRELSTYLLRGSDAHRPLFTTSE